ncbi:MAG: reverse transcriptase family protein [Bacteroidetes bacterium]|nr:reverse transcriptase family protein [Bacteroidota bacterium]
MKTRILTRFEFQDYIQGGVKGKDNISNAKIHQGNKYFFTTDLRNFFPSVKYNDVYKMFISNGFSVDVSSLLTKLTTYKYSVPQGIPTSTYITNLVAILLDKELIDICKCNGIKYTRYVGDLTFSSKKDFRNLITDIINIIISNHMKISYRKTKYKIGPIEITGIEVRNNLIKPSREVKNKFEKAEDKITKNSLRIYMERIK